MESLLALAADHPARDLEPGDALIVQGEAGGDLFVLESGQLVVERDGVRIATIATPGAPVGEMSVILGKPSSATVRAERPSTVRVISRAAQQLQAEPALAYRIAWLMANRLDATSALLVDLSREHRGKPEHGLFGRVLATLHTMFDDDDYAVVNRTDLFDDGSRPPPKT